MVRARNPDFNVCELAKALAVSDRQLSRAFVTHLHQTPSSRLRAVRLALAAESIVTLGPSVLRDSALARSCGFPSARALRDAWNRASPPAMGSSD
ncbi:helix-turn-helix domain-containing protein [Microbacterium enclense]|uniref:helix-turn-helix domain-containing protein n=1 Tax=Microbacterium enclense TaxID=993073 RepID=UPI00342AB27E